MPTKTKTKFNVHYKKLLIIASLLFVILLTSIVVYKLTINGDGSEKALRTAINKASSNTPTLITLSSDILLTNSALEIPVDKDITLVSDKQDGFWKLIGAANQPTISVLGKLTLEGVIVTHNSGTYGSGVTVNPNGTLILSGGVICNNTVEFIIMPDGNTGGENGGGVRNMGNFSMVGGVITNNTASGEGGGGGVLNIGNFSMVGGVITNNTASGNGGGVFNYGYGFSMSGGEISSNTAGYDGGGVYNWNGKVSLSDNGVICCNDAERGGGVYNYYATFDMSGGVISGNTAEDKGGGVYNYYYSVFSLSGSGEISNNTAPLGGGVCNDGDFKKTGGVINSNTVYDSNGALFW